MYVSPRQSDRERGWGWEIVSHNIYLFLKIENIGIIQSYGRRLKMFFLAGKQSTLTKESEIQKQNGLLQKKLN